MLDHSTAFEDLDAHVPSAPVADDAARRQPLHAWRGDCAGTQRRQPAWRAGQACRDGTFASIRPADEGCRLGFPEAPQLVQYGGDQLALMSSLIVVCNLREGTGGIHASPPGVPDGGLWISLPRRALGMRGIPVGEDARRHAAVPPTLAAWLPRDLFVAQRLLSCRMRSTAQVETEALQPLLEALSRRVNFVDLDACDLASAELVSPIAEGLGQMPERADFVDRVQRAAGISRRSVFRAFRQRVGMSAHQLGMELRARRAFDLLCHRRLPVSAIVAQLGYASQSHFCSHFKAAFGISPGRLQATLDEPPGLRSLQALLSPRSPG